MIGIVYLTDVEDLGKETEGLTRDVHMEKDVKDKLDGRKRNVEVLKEVTQKINMYKINVIKR